MDVPLAYTLAKRVRPGRSQNPLCVVKKHEDRVYSYCPPKPLPSAPSRSDAEGLDFVAACKAWEAKAGLVWPVGLAQHYPSPMQLRDFFTYFPNMANYYHFFTSNRCLPLLQDTFQDSGVFGLLPLEKVLCTPYSCRVFLHSAGFENEGHGYNLSLPSVDVSKRKSILIDKNYDKHIRTCPDLFEEWKAWRKTNESRLRAFPMGVPAQRLVESDSESDDEGDALPTRADDTFRSNTLYFGMKSEGANQYLCSVHHGFLLSHLLFQEDAVLDPDFPAEEFETLSFFAANLSAVSCYVGIQLCGGAEGLLRGGMAVKGRKIC